MAKNIEPNTDNMSDNYLIYIILLIVIVLFMVFGYFIRKLLNSVHDINTKLNETTPKLTTEDVSEVVLEKETDKVEEPVKYEEDVKLDTIDEQE
tara:strand:+ start:2347 stop:2628 length:282 start_codon:yes stop_codon:yes gene_type:complete